MIKKIDMRTIRFRGKSSRDGEWFFGNLYDKDTKGNTHIMSLERGCLVIDPDTVGEFTGLRDKNGRDIYEGDIYWRDPAKGWSSQAYCVEYCNGAWIGKDSDGGYLTLIEEDSDLISNQLDYIEVVGNIHDNPELLNAER